MKKLIFLFLLFFCIPPLTEAAGDDTRFDWSQGQSVITADNTNTCNDTAQARFDWVFGQTVIVHDTTANCTSVETSTTVDSGIIWFD